MSTKPTITLTAREMELLTMAFQCSKEKPNIDYEAMAAMAGLKGVKSARDSFGNLYNKTVNGAKSASPNDDGKGKDQDGETSPKKKSSPGKRKAVDSANKNDEGATPIKKKTQGKRKGKKEAATDNDDGEGGDASDTIAVKSEVVEQDA